MSRLLPACVFLVFAAIPLRSQIVLQHPGAVFWGRFSPDGQRVVTACSDGSGRIWSTDGALLHTLAGHRASVTGVEFSRDGSRIVTAGFDSTARIWDAGTGALLHTLRGHGGRVRQAIFSPDGALVATASLDGTARLWNSATGDTLHVLRGHTQGVFDIAFSPDGKRIATASNDLTGRIWDVSTGMSTATLTGHAQRLVSIIYDHSGNRLITTGFDPVAYVWDSTGALVDSIVHTARINSAFFSADDQRVLTSSFDTTARLTTLDRSVGSIIYRGHADPLLWAELDPSETMVVTSGFDNSARVYTLAGDTLMTLRHNGRVPLALFSPADPSILTIGFDSTARIWSLPSGEARVEQRSRGNLDIRMDGNGTATIEYNIDRRAPVVVMIIDTQGTEVFRLPQGVLEPGSYHTMVDLGSLPSGVYFCSLTGGDTSATRRFVMTR